MSRSSDRSSLPLPRLPSRDRAGHKGSYGKALLLGGSRGMSGALALAGVAALRSGAGLTLLGTPDSIRSEVATFFPCYTTLGLPEVEGGLEASAWGELERSEWRQATAVGIGPGLGRGESAGQLVCRMFTELPLPMVVDADGLFALANSPATWTRAAGPRILTPHPGEFVRLAESGGADRELIRGVQAGDADARRAGATWLVEQDASQSLVVVLKGHGTVVASPGGFAINPTGNPGMGTGGTGDVLTGVIVALLCQGLTSREAARLGAFVHGLAGDLGTESCGQIGLTAWDVAAHLPRAFLELPT